MRRPKALQGAAGLLRRGGDRRQPLGKHARGHGIGEPTVGEPAGTTQGRIGPAATPDRRSARLAWRGCHLHLLEAVEAPIVADHLARPQLADDLDAFAEARTALADRHTARL